MMDTRLRASVFAAVLGLLSIAPLTHAVTDAPIDMTTTGSIGNGGVVVPPAKGSAEFQAALSTLADGKAADAYALARALPDATERRAVQWASIYFHSGDI